MIMLVWTAFIVIAGLLIAAQLFNPTKKVKI